MLALMMTLAGNSPHQMIPIESLKTETIIVFCVFESGLWIRVYKTMEPVALVRVITYSIHLLSAVTTLPIQCSFRFE